MSEQFFSEDGVDRWCAENLHIPEHGLAVDVGAAHPEKYSNTAWLRNRGWSVIAIDGDAAYEPEWRGALNAYFYIAVISDNTEASFLVEPTNALVSRIHPQGKKVRSVNLAQFLTHELRDENPEHRRIDFMSIDIENSEPVALQQMFDVMWYPKILVVEYKSCHAGINVRTLELPMLQRLYRLAHMTDNNAIFVR